MSNYHETFRGVVYPWHCDHQGHMNVMYYLGFFDQSYWHLFSMIGFTREYLDEQRKGFVGVKDTITYSKEQGPGATIVIESGLTKIGSSSTVSFGVMKESETGDTAATYETVAVYFDLEKRAKSAFNDVERSWMEKHVVEPV